MSSRVTVFLLACFARFTAFTAIFLASCSSSRINSRLASSLTRSAPAFLIIRVTGAIGSSLIFIMINGVVKYISFLNVFIVTRKLKGGIYSWKRR